MSAILLLFNVAVITAYIRVRLLRANPRVWLPDGLIAGLFAFAFGSAWLRLFETSDDMQMISQMGSISFAMATIPFLFIGRVNPPIRKIYENFASISVQKKVTSVGLKISIVILAAIIAVTLSNPIINTLLIDAAVYGEHSLEARKAITSGSAGYLAPGLQKLFRDQFAPIMICAAVMLYKRPLASPDILIAGLAVVAAMLVSGQRTPIIVLTLAVLVSFSDSYHSNNRNSKARSFVGIAVIVASYAAFTAFLGRVGVDGSIVEVILHSGANFMQRVFVTVPHENFRSSPIWLTDGPTIGRSWMEDLSILLPGRDVAISNQLHSINGGSLDGNSPLALPVDLWFAWGWFAVWLVPPVYFWGLAALDDLLTREGQVLGYAARNVLLFNVPFMYSPYLFLLYGGLVSLPIILLNRYIAGRRAGPDTIREHG